MKNPFVTNGYVSPEYFCDREKETAKIVSLLTNENNIALISPRRLGKTDLLRHCFGQPEIKEHYHTFIIDIYATSSVRDFVNVFLLECTGLPSFRNNIRHEWTAYLGNRSGSYN